MYVYQKYQKITKFIHSKKYTCLIHTHAHINSTLSHIIAVSASEFLTIMFFYSISTKSLTLAHLCIYLYLAREREWKYRLIICIFHYHHLSTLHYTIIRYMLRQRGSLSFSHLLHSILFIFSCTYITLSISLDFRFITTHFFILYDDFLTRRKIVVSQR
jgi:hypothetical protein